MKRIKKGLLSLTLGLVLSLGVGASIGVSQEATPVKAEDTGKTVTWTASNVNNFYGTRTSNGLIDSVNGTSTGTIKTGTFEWNFKRTLTALDTENNKKDNVAWNSTYTGSGLRGYYQLGSNSSLESLELTTSAFSKYTVSSIIVNCASKAGAHKLSITIGEANLLTDEKTPVWDNGGGKLSLSCSNSGDISIAFVPDENTISSKVRGALYIKSLSVTYKESPSVTPEEEAEAWGKSFMEGTTTATCEDINADNSEDLIYSWPLFEAQYNKISDGAKEIVKKATANNNGSTYLEKAVARYDHIITRYGSKLGVNANFIGREIKSTSGTHNILVSADNSLTIAIIVIVSLVSVSSIIGTTIIIRKRKTN